MRYNVGKLPKKSMNNVYYSLDETFAFKEEKTKQSKVRYLCCLRKSCKDCGFSVGFINREEGNL